MLITTNNKNSDIKRKDLLELAKRFNIKYATRATAPQLTMNQQKNGCTGDATEVCGLSHLFTQHLQTYHLF